MPSLPQLIAVLKQEHALRLRHCRLLEAQGRALLACDRARFIALETEHAALLVEMEAQAVRRQEVLADDTGAPQTLSHWLETMPDDARPRRALESLRDALFAAASRAQTLARRNEMLIQNELNYLTFALDLFVEAGRTANRGYGGRALIGGCLGLDRRA